MSIIVNTEWQSEPEIFIGTIIELTEIPNGDDLPVLEMTIENSFEKYQVVMFQPHRELQLTQIPDCAVQLVLWEGERGSAVSRSDTVILMDTPDTLLHLPESKLACPEMAVNIGLLIESCPVQPLADFVRRVLGQPSVGVSFLNGVMQEKGFKERGSLARHSLDVAIRSFDACRGYQEEDRWVAAIAGLLHGLGRIELSDREQTDHLKIVLKTLRLLSKDLNWLSGRHFEAARSIQFIIASMYRLGSPVRPHPAAMVVQTAHLVASHLQTDLMDYAKRTLFDSKANPTKPALTKN